MEKQSTSTEETIVLKTETNLIQQTKGKKNNFDKNSCWWASLDAIWTTKLLSKQVVRILFLLSPTSNASIEEAKTSCL